jgi:NAD(P)-binding Rossmann-like domain
MSPCVCDPGGGLETAPSQISPVERDIDQGGSSCGSERRHGRGRGGRRARRRAVALYLCRAGLRVTLHEKSRHLGGRTRTRTIERFCFNLGPHALYCAGQGAAVLHDLGVRVDGNRPGPGAYATGLEIFHGTSRS